MCRTKRELLLLVLAYCCGSVEVNVTQKPGNKSDDRAKNRLRSSAVLFFSTTAIALNWLTVSAQLLAPPRWSLGNEHAHQKNDDPRRQTDSRSICFRTCTGLPSDHPFVLSSSSPLACSPRKRFG
ncbi:hypothetical protein L596_002545 [Steinernema carpocapsae]|uniref:Secreted protein n=1 Tax=Steinernema carpocapsae TaxID=34508 RepID=A0A4U8UQ28_STECR|nr:hypothetical protein L596_002545 [Steinernema carpocapsae]